MKKQLIAAAVAGAFALPAMAQVTLSGSISNGIVNSGASGAKTNVGSIGGGANAINLTATEDLGGGLSGGFRGQIRFNSSTGNFNSANGTGGDATGFHDASVFLSDAKIGTVRLGKIFEDSNCGFDPWGCLTGAGALTTTGIAASILTGAQTQANSIYLASPRIQGFGLTFQTTLNRVNEDRQVLNLDYSSGPISAQILKTQGSLAAGTGTRNGLTGGTKEEDLAIAVSYNFGFARLIYSSITGKNASDIKVKDIQYVAASIPMGAAAIWAAYSRDDNAVKSADTSWALGINYALSKRTSVGADIFEREVVGGTTGFALRARHTF